MFCLNQNLKRSQRFTSQTRVETFG